MLISLFTRTWAAVTDVFLSWKAQWRMPLLVKLRYILKVLSAIAWIIVLSVTYARAPSSFTLAVVVYLSPNMLAAILFLFPFVRRFLEMSNYRVVRLMLWWSQVGHNPFLFYYILLFLRIIVITAGILIV